LTPSAWQIALITAGSEPIAPASPQPLTPSGLWVQGVPVFAPAFCPRPHQQARQRRCRQSAWRAGHLRIFSSEHFKAVGDLPFGWQINNLDVTPMKEPKPPLGDSVIEHGDTSKALFGMGTRRDWSA
jgi:hypothetical protein